MDKLLTNPMRFAKEMVADVTKYAFGKGLVTLGVMLATFVSGAAFWPVVAGFIGWKSYRLFSGYNHYKDDMVKLYRDEIAQQMGIAPESVTREHLRVMARGDAVLGIEPNPVIAEALERRRGMALLSFCTALLSASVTAALLGFNASAAIESSLAASPLTGVLKESFGLGEMATKVSAGSISALSGLILHNGLDAVVGQSLGYFRATAHDRIALIARQREYGVKVSPQQVFDVFLAANPTFAKQVAANFNKGVTGFTAAEKFVAMQAIGVAESMQELADQINQGELKAGTLAFELDSTHAMQTLQKVRGSGYDREQQRSTHQERLVEARGTDQPRFAERVGQRASHGSFVDAEIARREAHAHRIHHSI